MREDKSSRHIISGRPVAVTTAIYMLCILITTVVTAKQPVVTPDPLHRSATLPFNEVLELYRHQDRTKQIKKQIPPVDAILERLEINGRILNHTLTAKAFINIEVLADKRWVSAPIMNLGVNTVIEALPNIKGGALVITDGQLRLVTKRKGRFNFEIGMSSTAVLDGDTRSVDIVFANATLARCNIGFDPSVFKLTGEIRERNGDVATLNARGNRCNVSWQHRKEYIAPSEITANAPEAEPVIPTAHASIVSTLEGEHILRIAYNLRFTGRKPITFKLPKGHRLLRAYLNGRPIAASAEQDNIELEVFAARAGQNGGELELVLAATDRDYLLSGILPLALPRPSWRTNALHLSAHLPAAFDYNWTSGTLSPVKKSPTKKYVYDIPEPGKALHFRQFLVHRSTPSLTLEYAVSLEGHYFRGGS